MSVSVSLLECIDDEHFEALWNAVNERYVPWEEFAAMPMPSGLSAEDAWEVLMTLRRGAGKRIPFLQEPLLWYNLPYADRVIAQEVLILTSAESDIAAHFSKCSFANAVPGNLVEDMLVLLERDGIESDYELLRAVILGERPPRNIGEQLARNYCNVLSRAFEQVGQDEAMCLDTVALWHDLTEGVPAVFYDEPSLRQLSADAHLLPRQNQLEQLCLSAYFWEYTFISRMTGGYAALFASLMQKLFLMTSGYRYVSLLPLGKEMIAHHDPVRSAFGPSRNWDDRKVHYDLTPYFSWYIQLVHKGLVALRAQAQEEERYEEDLRTAIEAAPNLNFRQQTLLLDALCDPDFEIDYAAHQARWQTTYATARSDITRLMNAGFLRPEQRGKRNLVFHAVTDLRRV